MQQQAAAEEGEAGPRGRLETSLPVGEGALGEMEVVAPAFAGAEGLAAQAGEESRGFETEVQLLVHGAQIAWLRPRQVAELVLVVGGELRLGDGGGRCQHAGEKQAGGSPAG